MVKLNLTTMMMSETQISAKPKKTLDLAIHISTTWEWDNKFQTDSLFLKWDILNVFHNIDSLHKIKLDPEMIQLADQLDAMSIDMNGTPMLGMDFIAITLKKKWIVFHTWNMVLLLLKTRQSKNQRRTRRLKHLRLKQRKKIWLKTSQHWSIEQLNQLPRLWELQ